MGTVKYWGCCGNKTVPVFMGLKITKAEADIQGTIFFSYYFDKSYKGSIRSSLRECVVVSKLVRGFQISICKKGILKVGPEG